MLEQRREIGSEEVDSVSLAELRRVNKIRRDFVANVSHELKTPATSLKLLAESLVEIMDEDPDQARFFAEQLKNETDRLAQLITDLLDLARLESEEGVQNPALVDVRSILMAVIARLRPAAHLKNITLSWKRSTNAAPYTVWGDETQLVSMFANLVDNAVKYTPRGGRVEVSDESNESEIVVRISDTGIGIPEKSLTRIFERFYRVDKARSKETGGTGLGLSIIRHVAENHGGRVTVESAPREGSTFTVNLPAVKPEESRPRVLFLCTHNSVRSQMAEGLLRHLARGCFEAHSAGTEAIAVRPQAIAAMDEIGIDISDQKSKTLERYLGEPFDYVITVCDEANGACPVFPNAKQRLHWSFEDPSQASGTEEERLEVFRRARDEIRQRIEGELIVENA
jgi:two-component system sensor histidine kinase SenX3